MACSSVHAQSVVPWLHRYRSKYFLFFIFKTRGSKFILLLLTPIGRSMSFWKWHIIGRGSKNERFARSTYFLLRRRLLVFEEWSSFFICGWAIAVITSCEVFLVPKAAVIYADSPFFANSPFFNLSMVLWIWRSLSWAYFVVASLSSFWMGAHSGQDHHFFSLGFQPCSMHLWL